jgi:hypothetical protein
MQMHFSLSFHFKMSYMDSICESWFFLNMDSKNYLQLEPRSRHGLWMTKIEPYFQKFLPLSFFGGLDIMFFQHGCQLVV